jgi:endonuclease/exonuclease/phosphatase family metal-dependent hydrolase
MADVESSSARTWAWAAVALTWLVVFECVRVLFPLLYQVRETAGSLTTVVIALVVFAAPGLGGPLARSLGVRTTFLLSVGVLVAGRVAMGFVRPIPLWIAAVATGLGLIAVALEIGARRLSGVALAAAVFVGLSADAVVRGGFQTWDAAWRPGALPVVEALAVGAGLLLCARAARGIGSGSADSFGAGAVFVGPFLLLELLFLQNPAFAASATGLSMSGAVALVLLGDVVAIATIATGRATSIERTVAAMLVVAGTAVLAIGEGASAGVALPLTQAGVAVVLASAFARGSRGGRTTARCGLAAALGLVIFVGLAFAYQIQIENPLPIPRATWVLAAAALLALAVVRAPSAVGVPGADREPVPWRVAVIPLAGLVVVPGALALGAPKTLPAPTGSRPIVLVDWNVHSTVNADGQIDPEAIARFVEAHHADVVVLQEVGRGWPISGEVDVAEWLSRRLEMPYAWAAAADGQFGNVVLSRFPIERASAVDLPYGDGPQQRSYVFAVLDAGAGRTLSVFGTHLQDGDRPDTNAEQIRTLIQDWGGASATVIAGDMNQQPTDPNIELFSAAGLVSAQDAAGLSGASTARDPNFPGDRVDWIFTAGDIGLSGFQIFPDPASDHLPLVVGLSLG